MALPLNDGLEATGHTHLPTSPYDAWVGVALAVFGELAKRQSLRNRD